MQLATSISLLLFACTSCALHLHHDADGFRSTIIQRRSRTLRQISRRRSIGPSIGLDIVPRGNPIPTFGPAPVTALAPPEAYDCSPFDSLQAIMRAKKMKRIHYFKFSSEVKIYRVLPPCTFDGKSAIVKEIRISSSSTEWNEDNLKKEIARLALRNELYGALLVGEGICMIMMEDLGDPWQAHKSTIGTRAQKLMREADERDTKIYDLRRTGLAFIYDDYTWTRHGRSWFLRPVGEWRHAKYLLGIPPKPTKHYCGIAEWKRAAQFGGMYLPVLLHLPDSPSYDTYVTHTAGQNSIHTKKA